MRIKIRPLAPGIIFTPQHRIAPLLSGKQPIVLQISRLSEGSTGQIFATSSVIYQIKTWGL